MSGNLLSLVKPRLGYGWHAEFLDGERTLLLSGNNHVLLTGRMYREILAGVGQGFAMDDLVKRPQCRVCGQPPAIDRTPAPVVLNRKSAFCINKPGDTGSRPWRTPWPGTSTTSVPSPVWPGTWNRLHELFGGPVPGPGRPQPGMPKPPPHDPGSI